VGDVLVDYFSEIKAGMDYGSLQGLAYRIVLVFWWEVLQINPDQQDLRSGSGDGRDMAGTVLDPHRRLPRREIHSRLFAVCGFLPGPGGVVARRTGPVGNLARSRVPWLAASRSCLQGTARRVPHPAPHPDGDAAPAGARGRGNTSQVLAHCCGSVSRP
jgi:hypothetical protein